MKIIDELQRRLQLDVIVHGDDELDRMWPAAWERYADGRFTRPDSKRKRKQVERMTYLVCAQFRSVAKNAGWSLDFNPVRLRHLALKSLSHPCPYCGELYGVDSFAIVRHDPTDRGQSSSYGIANVVVCCKLCGDAKGSMSGAEFLDVKEALRGARPGIAREAAIAMALGRTVMGKRKGKRYFPGPPACG